MKIGTNIELKAVLYIFWSYSFWHFQSYGHFFGPLVFYVFGPLNSVFDPLVVYVFGPLNSVFGPLNSIFGTDLTGFKLDHFGVKGAGGQYLKDLLQSKANLQDHIGS